MLNQSMNWWLVCNLTSQCWCRILLKSNVVCQSYGNVFSVIVFSWTWCMNSTVSEMIVGIWTWDTFWSSCCLYFATCIQWLVILVYLFTSLCLGLSGVFVFSCIMCACLLYYCNFLRLAWWDWELSGFGWLTTSSFTALTLFVASSDV